MQWNPQSHYHIVIPILFLGKKGIPAQLKYPILLVIIIYGVIWNGLQSGLIGSSLFFYVLYSFSHILPESRIHKFHQFFMINGGFSYDSE